MKKVAKIATLNVVPESDFPNSPSPKFTRHDFLQRFLFHQVNNQCYIRTSYWILHFLPTSDARHLTQITCTTKNPLVPRINHYSQRTYAWLWNISLSCVTLDKCRICTLLYFIPERHVSL